MEWDNGEGLIFIKKIELDDKYFFKITQSIKNNTNKSYELDNTCSNSLGCTINTTQGTQ